MIVFLFVYGTLRADPSGALSPWLRGRASLVGSGRVRARRHDLSAYPGAVPSSDAADSVEGELYRLDDPSVLADLDQYEEFDPADPAGSEFVRATTEVELDDGRQVAAWVYWWNRGGAEDQI